MTSAAAVVRLQALLPQLPTTPPDAWQVLIQRVGQETLTALARNEPFNVRDQAVLALALSLYRAGAHAGWALAPAQPRGRRQVDWLACARWHHDAQVRLNAAWERRIAPGTNRALPLEVNQVTPTPPPVQTTPLAQQWLNRLNGDPLTLPADQAALGLRAIPGGVWIAPPS